MVGNDVIDGGNATKDKGRLPFVMWNILIELIVMGLEKQYASIVKVSWWHEVKMVQGICIIT